MLFFLDCRNCVCIMSVVCNYGSSFGLSYAKLNKHLACETESRTLAHACRVCFSQTVLRVTDIYVGIATRDTRAPAAALAVYLISYMKGQHRKMKPLQQFLPLSKKALYGTHSHFFRRSRLAVRRLCLRMTMPVVCNYNFN